MNPTSVDFRSHQISNLPSPLTFLKSKPHSMTSPSTLSAFTFFGYEFFSLQERCEKESLSLLFTSESEGMLSVRSKERVLVAHGLGYGFLTAEVIRRVSESLSEVLGREGSGCVCV